VFADTRSRTYNCFLITRYQHPTVARCQLRITIHESWYVVQTKPRQEFRALEHLRNQGVRCGLPTIEAEKIRRGRRVLVNEPLFSHYLFVQLDATHGKWSVLRSTRGVTRLVEFGGVPARLPAGVIDVLMSCHAALRRLFAPGERVVVTQGPLAGLEGIYQMPDGEARAVVLLEFLSRPNRVAFPVEALRRTG